MTGSSTQGIKTVLHPVSDLATAKTVYAALLGVPPEADGPYYVGFEAGGQHIGLVPNGGPQGMTSPVTYWEVPDIEAKLAEVTAAGATVKEPARDVGNGRLVATVTDARWQRPRAPPGPVRSDSAPRSASPRGERGARPRADARRPLVGLTHRRLPNSRWSSASRRAPAGCCSPITARTGPTSSWTGSESVFWRRRSQ